MEMLDGKCLNASDTLGTTKSDHVKQRATGTSRTESMEMCIPREFTQKAKVSEYVPCIKLWE